MIILLMGPPGSGKTSIGQKLAVRLNYKWIDVDDHVLEPEWKCSVGQKLFQVGEKRFLKVKTGFSLFFSIGTVSEMSRAAIDVIRIIEWF